MWHKTILRDVFRVGIFGAMCVRMELIKNRIELGRQSQRENFSTIDQIVEHYVCRYYERIRYDINTY
jgi:hypothetical protein